MVNHFNSNPTDTSTDLTAKKLEQWFASLEKNNPKTNPIQSQTLPSNVPGLASQFLSRFGIKNATDVIAFLKSPEGKAVAALLQEELAEIQAIEDYDAFLAQEEQKREHRMLGFLLLALMYEQDANADAINEIIAAQNTEQIKRAHDAATYNPDNDAFIEHAILVQQDEAFNSAIDALDDQLKGKTSELDQVDQTLSNLMQQRQELNREHEIFDNHLNQLDNVLASTAQQTNQSEAIERQIKSLQATMDEQLNEIQALIEKGQDSEARQKLIEHQGYHLQVAGLQDMQDVLKGEKYFANAEGQSVSSSRDAHFVLENSQKIVKDPTTGRYHLIAAHEDLQSIKQASNAQEKLNASHEHYKQALTKNTSVRAKALHNKQQKDTHHSERETATLRQKAQIQNDIAQLSTQKTKLLTDQVEVKQQLRVSHQARLSAPNGSFAPNTTIPQPRPQPQLKTSPPQDTNSLMDALKSLKNDHSSKAIARVKELAKLYTADPQFQSLSNQIGTIGNMPRTAPIPKIAMDRLLQTSRTLGVNPEKPNVAPLSAATMSQQAEATPEAEDNPPSKTPTPTNTKLRPPGF